MPTTANILSDFTSLSDEAFGVNDPLKFSLYKGQRQYQKMAGISETVIPNKKVKGNTRDIILDNLWTQVTDIHNRNRDCLFKVRGIIPMLTIQFFGVSPVRFRHKPLVSIALLWNNAEEKEKITRAIKDIIEAYKGNIRHMVFSSDMWYTKHKKDIDIDRVLPPQESPRRKEALMTIAFTPDLKYKTSIYTPYSRKIIEHKEVIILEKDVVVKQDNSFSFYILEKMLGLTPDIVKTEAKLPIDIKKTKEHTELLF